MPVVIELLVTAVPSGTVQQIAENLILAQAGLSESALKKLFKEALAETLQEQRELHDVFAEVLEDIALAEAIRKGQQTEQVAREEIFSSLEGNAVEDRIPQDFWSTRCFSCRFIRPSTTLICNWE